MRRKRTTKKASWSKEQMETALSQIPEAGIRQVSRDSGIPYTTLQNRSKRQNANGPVMGRKATFSVKDETALADYCITLSTLFYGITPLDLRRLAYQFAETRQLKHGFNQTRKMAGKDWFYAFMKRNPRISIRKPEPTSIHRILAFNKEEVDLFYSILGDIFQTEKVRGSRIYNVDETGISVVQRPSRIIAEKGVKRVGAATSMERGKNVTVICSMSTVGHFIPPYFIFPLKRVPAYLNKTGPVDAVYDGNNSGWSTAEIFLKWLKFFRNQTRPVADDPVLLILDNHSSHISSDIIDFCRENYIFLISIPPHTSHRMQPLDLTFFGPLKTFFNSECDNYMKTPPYSKIKMLDLPYLFKKAFETASTMRNAMSGFRESGIFPFNPSRFEEKDFPIFNHRMTCSSSDDSVSESVPSTSANQSDLANTSSANLPTSSSPSNLSPSFTPVTSKTIRRQKKVSVTPSTKNLLMKLHPKPVLDDLQKKKISSRKQHAECLTSSPFRARLMEKIKVRQETEAKKKAAREKREEKAQEKAKKLKGKKAQEKRKKLKMKVKVRKTTLSFNMQKNEDDICYVCSEGGKNNELWYRCIQCAEWAHAECTSWDTAENFICDYCDV